MAAQDPYSSNAPTADGPATRIFAVVPSDSLDLAFRDHRRLRRSGRRPRRAGPIERRDRGVPQPRRRDGPADPRRPHPRHRHDRRPDRGHGVMAGLGIGLLLSARGGSALSRPAYDPPSRTATGRAPPGAVVTVLLDGASAGSATTSAEGRWAFAFASAPAAGQRIAARAEITSASLRVAATEAGATGGDTVRRLAGFGGDQGNQIRPSDGTKTTFNVRKRFYTPVPIPNRRSPIPASTTTRAPSTTIRTRRSTTARSNCRTARSATWGRPSRWRRARSSRSPRRPRTSRFGRRLLDPHVWARPVRRSLVLHGRLPRRQCRPHGGRRRSRR